MKHLFLTIFALAFAATDIQAQRIKGSDKVGGALGGAGDGNMQHSDYLLSSKLWIVCGSCDIEKELLIELIRSKRSQSLAP